MPSSTHTMTLDAVVARLGQHEAVEGVVIIGSASAGTLHAASDYDLVIVLRETADPFNVGVTSIDGRLADLIFVPMAQVERILVLNAPVDADEGTGRVVRWLQAGRVALVRSGRLAAAGDKVGRGDWLLPIAETAAHDAWFRVNYNLAQTGRLLRSGDPLYLLTAEVRMALYGPPDLLFGYFTIRKLRWEGDKAAVRYVTAHDPSFWDLFRQFVAATNRDLKFELYEQAAALATAPQGGLWTVGATAMEADRTRDLWEQLLGA